MMPVLLMFSRNIIDDFRGIIDNYILHNWWLKVMLRIVASLTVNSRGVIYNYNIFIIQQKLSMFYKNIFMTDEQGTMLNFSRP